MMSAKREDRRRSFRPPPIPDPIDWEEVELLYADGLSYTEIGRQVGCNPVTVSRGLRKRGVPRRPRSRNRTWSSRKLYQIWQAIRSKCRNPDYSSYPRFGGCGVDLCKAWDDFEAFAEWARESGYRQGMSLVLRRADRNFAPSNCLWIPYREVARRNRCSISASARRVIHAFGERKGISEWAADKRCRVTRRAIAARLAAGYPPEAAITLPPRAKLDPSARLGERERESGRRRVSVDWAEAIRRYGQGQSYNEIARDFGVTASNLATGLRRRGFPKRPPAVRSADDRALYAHWHDLLRRCTTPEDPRYQRYGGRGIRLCEGWMTFSGFRAWAVRTGWKHGLVLERIDNTADYRPDNCQWATRTQLGRRPRPHFRGMPPRWKMPAFGEEKGITEWSRDSRCVVSLRTLRYRVRGGMSPEEALRQPPRTQAGERGTTFIRAFGKTQSLSEWLRDKRCKVLSIGTIRERMKRGMVAEDAIATPPYRIRGGTRSRSR